jgi:hypothetical protein
MFQVPGMDPFKPLSLHDLVLPEVIRAMFLGMNSFYGIEQKRGEEWRAGFEI